MKGVHGVALALAALCVTDCRFLDFTEKVDGAVERARIERDRARGPTALVSQGSSPLLQATPTFIDFGVVRTGAERTQTITFTNQAAFAVTVVNLMPTHPEFSATVPTTPFVVPAHGQVSLTVVFRPADKGDVSGALQLELDTAGPRSMRVPVRGRGGLEK